MSPKVLATGALLTVLALSCRTVDGGAGPAAESAAEQSRPEKSRSAKPRAARRAPKAPPSDLVSYDLRIEKKDERPEVARLRQQIYEQFSIDALLACAGQHAEACPRPLPVKLRVDQSGVVQGVSIRGAKAENPVWIGCLEATYKKIQFDAADAPFVVRTRFHVDCKETADGD